MAQNDLSPDQALDALRKLPEDQQRSVLSQLPPDTLKAIRAKLEVPKVDFTSKLKGKENEGLYQMTTNGADFVGVPYSRVMEASKAGYKIKPDDRETYASDRLEEMKKNPANKRFLTEGEFRSMELPEAASSEPSVKITRGGDGSFTTTGNDLVAGAWNNLRSGVESATEPTNNYPGKIPLGLFTPKVTAEADLNTIKRIGRTLFGIADFGPQAYSALKDSLSNDPQKAIDGEARLLQMHPAAQISGRLKELRDDWKKEPKQAVENVAGDAIGLWLGGKATEKVMHPVAAVSGPLEKIRGGVRDSLGVFDNTERTVGKYGKEAEAARKAVRDADQRHLEETQDALHETRGIEMKHEAEKKLALSKAEEANAAAAKEHLEQTQEALHTTTGTELEAEAANRAAKVEALKKTQEAEREHQAKVEEVRKHNEAVLRDRAKRVETQRKLDDASKELDDKIDAAQKNAKKANDDAWEAWRNKVANVQVDMQPVVDVIKAQTDKMSPEQVSVFKEILRETTPAEDDLSELDRTRNAVAKGQGYNAPYEDLPPDRKAVIDEQIKRLGLSEMTDEATSGAGGGGTGLKQIPASRLHGWKTQLEDAVRADRTGNVKYAIGQVLDAVRKLEEDASKEAGADDLLKKARALHGPYVDTFRNSQTTPGTAANYVRSKVTPGFTKDAKLEDYLARLEAYDPSIPKTVEHLNNLQAGLKALPKEQPLREQIKPLPPSPSAPVKPALKVPDRAPLPDRPATVEPAAVKPPERVAPPDKPVPAPPPEVPNIQAENLQYIDKALRKYGKIGSWVLRIVVGGLAEHLAHGNLSEFGGELLIGQMGVTMLTKALRSPSVLEWLAKPSAEDLQIIDTLPPQDAAKLRQALGVLANEDRIKNPALRNVKIAPAMAAFLAGGSAAAQNPPALPEVHKQADQLQSPPAPAAAPPPAPGPQASVAVGNLQRIIESAQALQGGGGPKPVWTHIFDPESGTIRAA
jgi:hypothetical protein